MPEIIESKNLYIENDKWNAPFLLAASFHNLIKFSGSFLKDGVLYWQFTPQEVACSLIECFRTRTEPHIPSFSLFEAIEIFWRQVAEIKNHKDSRTP